MASLTIRKLSDRAKTRLRVSAARAGRSMEEEARRILESLEGKTPPVTDLAAFIAARTDPLGGAELEPPPRDGRFPPFLLESLDEQAGREERALARKTQKARA